MIISTSCFQYKRIIGGYDKALPKLKEIGFGALDIPLCLTGSGYPDPDFSAPESVWKKKYAELAEKIKDNGLFVGQTHGHYHGSIIDECKWDQALIDLIEKELEAAAIIGAPYLVVHPLRLAKRDEKRQEDFKLNLEFYAQLKAPSERTGVKIAIENLFKHDGADHYPTGCSYSKDLAAYIDAQNSDRFVACLDTGHANIVGESPAEAVRTLGKRLKLLHVHDNFASGDHHNLPGFGTIEWEPFIDALKEVGYEGTFNFETESFSRLRKISPEVAFDYAQYAFKLAKNMLGE